MSEDAARKRVLTDILADGDAAHQQRALLDVICRATQAGDMELVDMTLDIFPLNVPMRPHLAVAYMTLARLGDGYRMARLLQHVDAVTQQDLSTLVDTLRGSAARTFTVPEPAVTGPDDDDGGETSPWTELDPYEMRGTLMHIKAFLEEYYAFDVALTNEAMASCEDVYALYTAMCEFRRAHGMPTPTLVVERSFKAAMSTLLENEYKVKQRTKFVGIRARAVDSVPSSDDDDDDDVMPAKKMRVVDNDEPLEYASDATDEQRAKDTSDAAIAAAAVREQVDQLLKPRVQPEALRVHFN